MLCYKQTTEIPIMKAPNTQSRIPSPTGRLGPHTPCLLALYIFCAVTHCHGQGTFEPLLITFDGPPIQPAGTAAIVQRYDEVGVSFTPIDPSATGSGFVRCGPATDPRDPENGSGYLQALAGHSLSFSFIDGSLFDLLSVDLAEYSTVVPDSVTVQFVGYRWDGGTVSTSFTTDGIIDGTGPLADFETFHFGPEFSGLTRVEIPTFGWSLDNLVVAVPEPGAWALLLLGGGLLGVCWGKRRDRA